MPGDGRDGLLETERETGEGGLGEGERESGCLKKKKSQWGISGGKKKKETKNLFLYGVKEYKWC